jgi:hypothetical protein
MTPTGRSARLRDDADRKVGATSDGGLRRFSADPWDALRKQRR